MAADAKIQFELGLDLSQVDAVINQAAERVRGRMTNALSGMGKAAESQSKSAQKSIKAIGTQSESTASVVQGAMKKIASALAGAFAVKKLVDFGRSCIELGSDLVEVQNVVDKTFPHMSAQIDTFAQNAAKNFGLSETMAKNFTGTFGAMAQAFGLSESAAYDMATTLTGLAGDVASFYNISQDEAYTKLKSVFTGETESLKELGVVMTQTALDSYALANGFGKTTSAMTEAEKVALRYKFVQDQLSFAIGDFADTSTGWANQVRILQLQFDSLKATIGQGLIAAFSPVIQVLNAIIGKLITAANAVKAFFNLLGGKAGGGSAKALTSGTDAVAKSADSASSALGGTGSAAKKAANDIKTSTTGIDELNIISADTGSSGSGSGSGGSGGGYAAEDFDFGTAEAGADAVSEKLQKIVDLFNDLKNSFTSGFWDAFGDTSVFDSIQSNIDRIKTALTNIFTDSDVQAKAYECANTIAYAFGQITGSVASIGASIADGLTGAIANYLEQNTPRIQEYIMSMLDVAGQIASRAGDFAQAVGVIFEVFRSDSAKQIGADLIGIFSDSFMGVTELAGKFVSDIFNVLVQPIIDNAGQIKERVQGLLDELQPLFDSLKQMVDGVWDGLNTAYDNYVHPVLQGLADGLSGVIDWLTETQGRFDAAVGVVTAFFAAWEVVKIGEFVINAGGVVSLLAGMASGFAAATVGVVAHAAALVADKIETAAIVALYAKDFVVNLAQGTAALVKQAAQFALNTAAKIADTAAQVAMTAATVLWNAAAAVATTVTTALGAAIAFLTSPIGLVIVAITALIAAGVLLYTHWDEVKTFALATWDAIKTGINSAIDAVKEFIAKTVDAIKQKWEAVWNAIKTFISSLWNAIKTTATTIFTAIKDKLAEIWDNIKNKIETIWNAVKQFFSDVWNGIKDTVSGLVDAIHDKISSVMETIKTGIQTALDTIKGKWEEIWGGLKTTTIEIFDGIWNGIKGAINSILSGVETMANGVVRGINKMIDALNNLSFDIPDWVPGIGGESFGLNIPTIPEVSLPRLANGGYVQANTPQLAMIGDNRTQGEIVSPEDKLQEMALRAAEMAQNGGAEYMQMAVELLQRIISLIESMDLTVNIDIREIKKQLTNLENRTGYTLRTT